MRSYKDLGKICSICKKEKPLSEFDQDKSKKDGLTYRCKQCVFLYNKKYYKKHPKVFKYMKLSEEELNKVVTKNFLEEEYINKNKKPEQIGKLIGCSRGTIRNYLKKYNIPLRSRKEAMKGLLRKGKLKPKGFGDKISKIRKGIKQSKETCLKKSIAMTGKKGEKSNNWKGGVSPLSSRIRSLFEYKVWVGKIFERDAYKCQECGKGGNIEAHHIKEFCKILSEFLQTYSQFSPIEDKETLVRLAISYQPFWDLSNGKTLCLECHAKTYKKIILERNNNE